MPRPRLAFGPDVRHPRSEHYPAEFGSGKIKKRVTTLCTHPTTSVFSSRPRPQLALTSGPAGDRGHVGPAVVVHPVVEVSAVASPSPIPVRSVPPSPVGFKPASEPGCKGGRPGGTSVKLFSPRARPMATPSRHTARVDLSADGCPEWGSNFCLLSTRGSTVYCERVNTVREIEVLSTELLDKDPYLVARWQTLWADNHITNRDQLRSIRKST